jgi:DNA polymerase-4
MRIVMHIDVNNAFLSWTAVKLLSEGYKYDIRNSYAVIGGDPKKRTGIVLAKSTPAKKMGVVTGETLFSARKKCPSLRSYPGDYQYYESMSSKFINIVKKYTPDIEQMSIDECALEYTNVQNLYGDPIKFAYKLQKEIYDTLGFTVNIGIGNNKLCAKMASDFSKPNKVHTCFMEDVPTKIWPLSVGDLFGIGHKSAIKLEQLNIKTIGDLAHTDVKKLYPYFKNMAPSMIEWANGIDNTSVISESNDLKGIGNEITIDHDVINHQELENYLVDLADYVSMRLRKENKYATVICVNIKDNRFKRSSHQHTIPNPTNNTDEILTCAKMTLKEMYPLEPIRLIGLRLTGLRDNQIYQVSLFDDDNKNKTNEVLDDTIDNLKDKYGLNIIKKASTTNHKVGK